MIKRVEIQVLGRVQGVFFRSQTAKKAKELNLTGWVKNEEDSSVKIVAEGEEENLKNLIEWTKEGPLLARVDKIEVEWEEGKGEFEKFEIKY
jgi:acylphosphatase